MIFGIGTDVVEVARIKAIHERYGERFVQRLLMSEELAAFSSCKRPTRFLAMHFAAKEAIVKALGTGFAHGVWIRDVGFLADSWGKPEIVWSPRGREVCAQLGAGEGHVTLTDEAGLVVAVAVLMREEKPA